MKSGGEEKKRKKYKKGNRRDMENGGDSEGEKNIRQESVGDPEHVENRKVSREESARGSGLIITTVERACPHCRVWSEGFRNKYNIIDPPLVLMGLMRVL